MSEFEKTNSGDKMGKNFCLAELAIINDDDATLQCFRHKGHKGLHKTLWNLKNGKQAQVSWNDPK